MPQSPPQSHGAYFISHFAARNSFSLRLLIVSIWKSKLAKRALRARVPTMVPATISYEQVKDDALHLPIEDRSRLASRLLESLDDDDDVSPEWKDELDRRLQEIDEGKAVMIPHAEVMASVRASLAKNRELRASQGS
jgi:putative addiction module component (TIGR02574 family)